MAEEKAFTGLTAKVTIGEETIGYISGVDMTMEKSIIEILSFGKRWKEKVPAIGDWSASIDGTAAFVKNGSQNKLIDAFNNDTLLNIGIYLDENTYFKGKAYMQSLNLTAAPDDKISITGELSGSEGIALTVPEVQGE